MSTERARASSAASGGRRGVVIAVVAIAVVGAILPTGDAAAARSNLDGSGRWEGLSRSIEPASGAELVAANLLASSQRRFTGSLRLRGVDYAVHGVVSAAGEYEMVGTDGGGVQLVVHGDLVVPDAADADFSPYVVGRYRVRGRGMRHDGVVAFTRRSDGAAAQALLEGWDGTRTHLGRADPASLMVEDATWDGGFGGTLTVPEHSGPFIGQLAAARGAVRGMTLIASGEEANLLIAVGGYESSSRHEEHITLTTESLDVGGRSLRGDLRFSRLPLPVFAVDPTVTPRMHETQAPDGRARRIVALTDEHNVQTDFVADELVVFTDDERALQAFLDRWSGVVVDRIDPDLPGTDLPTQHLVRLDPSGRDASRLAADLRALDPETRGSLRATSASALGLLAIAAREARRGVVTAINVVAYPDAITDRHVQEAAAGATYPGTMTEYDRNPFTWVHMNAGSPQDIGVTEAWRTLARAGRLRPASNTSIAVLDGGFASQPDYPISAAGADGVINTAPCGGRWGSCPWHGTEVAHVAAARVGNGIGTAGTGGPVANLQMYPGFYDTFTVTRHLIGAAVSGADIINMSFGAFVTSTIAIIFSPFDAPAFAARREGVLLVAAAGNEGSNVDYAECVGPCWEPHYTWPCEAPGVTCIGGLDANTRNRRHPDSNFGADSVRLYAPYLNYTGSTPQFPDDRVRVVGGTSFAAPYVAGVAALVEAAAGRNLHADEIESILYSTAHDDWRSLPTVQAHAAVLRAMADAPPDVEIQAPSRSARVHLGSRVAVRAEASDRERVERVEWSFDGRVVATGTTAEFVVTGSPGDQPLTATVVDSGGQRYSETIIVRVVNDPPDVTIVEPRPGQVFYASHPIALVGTSHDINTRGGLTDEQVYWVVHSLSGRTFHGHRATIPENTLPPGTHYISFNGEDEHGAAAQQQQRVVEVQAAPADSPPWVIMDEPVPDSFTAVCCDDAEGVYARVRLRARAGDPEDDAAGAPIPPADVVWTTTTDLDGDGVPTTTVVATGYDAEAKLYIGRADTCAAGQRHHLAVTVRDSSGQSASVQRTVRVGEIC